MADSKDNADETPVHADGRFNLALMLREIEAEAVVLRKEMTQEEIMQLLKKEQDSK